MRNNIKKILLVLFLGVGLPVVVLLYFDNSLMLKVVAWTAIVLAIGGLVIQAYIWLFKGADRP